MPRGGRNIPSLQQRFALKGKLLVKKYKGQLVVQSWPKPYGKARSPAQAATQEAFKRFQRAVKYFPPQQIITAMELTAGTGMYPRDLMMAASLGTNVMIGYSDYGAHPMIGDGLQKFVATGGETEIDFQNIPLGYSSLLISLFGRTNRNAGADTVTMRFNGDAANDYDWLTWWDAGNGTARGQTSAITLDFLGATAPAGYCGSGTIMIPNYATPAFYKAYIAQGVRMDALTTGNPILFNLSGYWRKADQVSRVTLTTVGGMIAGSSATLYGLY